MDGSLVKKGDFLYDILLGTGVVIITDQFVGFTLDFGGERRFSYDVDGRFHGQKRAYWADPVIRVPKKNDQALSLILKLIKVVDHDK